MGDLDPSSSPRLAIAAPSRRPGPIGPARLTLTFRGDPLSHMCNSALEKLQQPQLLGADAEQLCDRSVGPRGLLGDSLPGMPRGSATVPPTVAFTFRTCENH